MPEISSTSKGTVSEQLLSVLFQHRAATTAQLHRLLSPQPHLVYLRRCLRALREAGLVDSVDRAYHPSVWALTRRGQVTVLGWPQFAGRRAYRAGAGVHSVHTLTVTRTAVVFLQGARLLGDEFGPLDWRVEVAHPVRDGAGDGERMLIADALLHYTRTQPHRALLRALVEVDRATESSERLASKLITYARYHGHHGTPGGRRGGGPQLSVASWQRAYPVFPRVLFVLTGAGPRALAQRIADLRAMARQHPLAAPFAAQVPVGAAVLEDLEEQGASSPVWSSLSTGRASCTWMDV
ncbi:replication-relaxation family protein [Streptomyces luteireticuli]|uniref:replication-relaxation family protein n=1 Tax=Streptomyces luteireticuli TaxID=173858 RepID=UPI0035560733